MSVHILAFDTSSHVTAVAVTRDDLVLSEEATPCAERHAQTLLPRVQACLASAKLALADIDLIAVGIGPGSFTGVRVGLATAKGFALASGTPLRGVVSLTALARAAFDADGADPGALLAPMLDAHKAEVFGALYACAKDGELVQLVPPFHAPPQLAAARIRQATEGRRTQLVGSGFRLYAEQITTLLADALVLAPAFDTPSASALAREARRAFLREGASDASGLVPLYLRGSDAQLPKSPLRLS